jgi:hypothetical protein
MIPFYRMLVRLRRNDKTYKKKFQAINTHAFILFVLPRRREPIFPPQQALHDLDYEWVLATRE